MVTIERNLLQSGPPAERQLVGLEQPISPSHPFHRFQMNIGEEYSLYKAGDPGYLRPFFRDSVTATLLAEDPFGLREILRFGASKQGVKKDPRTGEEPGAIFHEYDPQLDDGVELPDRPGKTTLYNADEAEALFLLGHEKYISFTGDRSLSDYQRGNIISATDKIVRHLDENNLYVVDPKHSDADSYALRVTYWKDSHLKGRENGEPLYPVVYPLAHIQNMAGLRSAAHLLGSQELLHTAEGMKNGLKHLFDNELDSFSLAIDRGGRISGISSDVLHALYYLEPGDLEPDVLGRFLSTTTPLETSIGYRTMSPEIADEIKDTYHAKTVWTHEQAIIHSGAARHFKWAAENGLNSLCDKLQEVQAVSSRVRSYMEENPESDPELFLITAIGEIEPGGCDPQLWAKAARLYFERQAVEVTS